MDELADLLKNHVTLRNIPKVLITNTMSALRPSVSGPGRIVWTHANCLRSHLSCIKWTYLTIIIRKR